MFGAQNPGPSWKIYFHDYCIAMQTMPYVTKIAQSADNQNVSTFDRSDWGAGNLPTGLGNLPSTFMDDVSFDGALPRFAFIEPRYFNNVQGVNPLPPNSNHPGGSNYGINSVIGVNNSSNPPIDALSGEYFLMQVYNALVASPAWNETLLIITYDEPGGLYDSKPPRKAAAPAAFNLSSPTTVPTPPWPNVPDAQDAIYDMVSGFPFDVLGGRVPTIVVSPHIEAGSRIHHHHHHDGRHFDHTSIIRTVWDLFDLSGESGPSSLTARDAAALSLLPYVQDDAVNETGAFLEKILTSPGSLVFERTATNGLPPQTLLAATGDGATLTVTATVVKNNDKDEPWLTVEPNPSIPNAYTVTAQRRPHHRPRPLARLDRHLRDRLRPRERAGGVEHRLLTLGAGGVHGR